MLAGNDFRRLFDRSRTVRNVDHSVTSGILLSLLLERLSSSKLGSSSRHSGIDIKSLLCTSIVTTCEIDQNDYSIATY